MALKSEQARVLRRRVVGGLVRNLALFTIVFFIAAAALETFAVPSIADYVAASTSSWRTLNSSDQFRQLLIEQGLLENDLFTLQVNEYVSLDYPSENGTAEKIQSEIMEMEDALAEYATSGESARKEKQGQEQDAGGEVSTSGAATDAAAVDILNSDASMYVEQENTAKSNKTEDAPPDSSDSAATVPLVSYQDILAAEGIDSDQASAAQAMAALQVAFAIQELKLALAVPSPVLPPETTQQEATQILVSAALMGYVQDDLDRMLSEDYRTSQNQAYDTWMTLNPSEQAQTLGIGDEHPSWQIVQNDSGAYSIRDLSTYNLVKSFKLPLAALVFVAGWLFLIFHSLNRSLRCFDELSGAVATLLADKDAPINLPADLSIARNELTVIRQQSLADERAAKAAEQRKNELVAYLAHDIRTPLTSVLGYLDLLRETTDLPRDTLRKYADVAYSKAERLEGLINEFFEITRYNLSAIPIERETIGVRLFCQQVAEAFFPEASARHIRISVDVGPSEQFFVDPDKLARALGNVLRNAVAYADANSVIALAARQDARTTTITVSNRGREISEAHLESIFEKFYREDGARTTRSGGAGLGLAIAKEIVVAHHGDIEAASRRGVTVFTLRIPTRGEDDYGTTPIAPAASAPRIETPGVGESVPAHADAGAPPHSASPRPTPPRPGTNPGRHPANRRTNVSGLADQRRDATRPRPTERIDRPSERSATHRQSAAPLNPRNARHSAVPPRRTVRDNDLRPRRRGLPR